MAAPEIMDAVRMAINHVHDRYMSLALDMRRNADRAEAIAAEGRTMIVKTDFAYRLQTVKGNDIPCNEVGHAGWSLLVDSSRATVCNVDAVVLQVQRHDEAATLVIVDRTTATVVHAIKLPIRQVKVNEMMTFAARALAFECDGKNLRVAIEGE